MLVYNITYAVPHEIHEEWLAWMKNIHIPEMMSIGLFSSHTILRLIEMDEQDGVGIAVQFKADNEEDYRKYITEHAPGFRLKAKMAWGEQVLGFRTLMEIVQ